MSKIKVVMSDLHLGAGRADAGNALEDFQGDEMFGEYLGELVAESEEQSLDVELIFAGDAFEFLQVPSLDTSQPYDPAAYYPIEYYASSSEEDSRHKMELIISGHPLFFGALRDFIQATSPRRGVTFIKGNHDVNLHWLAVQETIRATLGATEERAGCLVFEERRITREGIYVEHGHQYTERLNRFPDFEEPHDPESPDQLYLPPGSRFVFRFFNEIERERYWIDGVKPLTALIWYALAFDFALAIRALLILLREAPAIIWGSLPSEHPTLEGIAAQEPLLQEMQDAEHMLGLEKNPAQRQAFCDRVEAALTQYSAPRRKVPAEGLRSASALQRGLAEEAAQRSELAIVAEQKRVQEKARVVIFGHTHAAGSEPLGDGAIYINSGTWTWVRDFSGEDASAWKRLWRHPEQYTNDRRLTCVRIDYAPDGTPTAQLRELRREEPEPERWWQRLWGWVRGRGRQ